MKKNRALEEKSALVLCSLNRMPDVVGDENNMPRATPGTVQPKP